MLACGQGRAVVMVDEGLHSEKCEHGSVDQTLSDDENDVAAQRVLSEIGKNVLEGLELVELFALI